MLSFYVARFFYELSFNFLSRSLVDSVSLSAQLLLALFFARRNSGKKTIPGKKEFETKIRNGTE